MLLLHFLLSFAICFPIVIFLITLFKAYREDGDTSYINLFFVFLLTLAFFFTSCSKEDAYPPLCPGGCNAQIEVELEQDINGYYIVPSNMSRFNIHVTANETDPYYFYNDQSVIEATFDSEITEGRFLYLGKKKNYYYTKKIVGPILESMVGDTISLTGDVYWDGGNNFKIQEFSFKFIIE